MKVKRFISQYLSSNCYLITENAHGFLIDPCCNDELELQLKSKSFTLDFVLLTHEHADHISGIPWLKQINTSPVVCSDKCAINIKNDRMNYSRYYNVLKVFMQGLGVDDSITMSPFICNADKTFSKDMKFFWDGHEIFLKKTPGHSEGSICCLIDQVNLFGGDTLFQTMETATRFKSGSMEAFQKISLPWLRELSPDTLVYPGHFETFYLRDWMKYKGEEL